MLFGSSKLVGLDIGISSIKLVEVDQSRKNVTLSSFGFIPTPPGSIVGGEIVNPEALSAAIATLVQQTRTKRKKACTAIWGTAVITKKITIPRIEENLLGEQLRWEAEQYIPFDIKDINLNYQVLRNANTSPEQMSILLVAAKRDFVLRYAEVIEAAGLECAIIDVAGFALANCFEVNYPQYKSHTVALLNIGAGMTNFVVIENGEATFSRDIPVGGNTYTTDIQKALNVSLDEAESLKISAGTGQAVAQEVVDTINSTNEVVAEEIRRSFDFFMATSADVQLNKIFVTGGGVGVPRLFEQIKTALALPVESFNPFISIQHNRSFNADYISQIAPYAGVGVGLAMRQVGKMIKINLLRDVGGGGSGPGGGGETAVAMPVDVPKDNIDVVLKLIVLFLPVILVYAYRTYEEGVLSSELKDLNARQAKLEVKLHSYDQGLKDIERFQEEKRKLDSQLDVIRHLSKERLKNVKSLDALQGLLPTRAWLTSFKIADNKVQMVGLAPDDLIISDFIQALEQSIYFTNVVLEKSSVVVQPSQGTMKEFTIQCVLENL